jgi:hypothetical protein
MNSDEIKNPLTETIKCKYVHEQEMFIASNNTLWPCCFLWSETVERPEKINETLNKYDAGWNSLKLHSIDEILAHPWYQGELEESWNPSHPMHISRCITNCALNRAMQNEITNHNEQE